MDEKPKDVRPETSAEKAQRLAEKLRAVLKEKVAGGRSGEALLRWVRSDGESGGPGAR